MTTRRLLRGGLVADGIGTEVLRADVLIEDHRILAVEPDLSHVDAEVIDLEPGSIVCPGFIDAHVHAEGTLAANGYVAGALAQGVTTLIVGQDGSSWIGATPATADYLTRYFGPVNGPAPTPLPRVADYAALVAGRLVQNVAVLASHGTIRHNIAGATDRPLDQTETAAARAQVEQALTDGAVGLSTGFDYVPSRFGAPDELTALCTPLADARLPYVSHLRGYGPTVHTGLAELTDVGHRAGVPVHASHLWGTPADIDTALTHAADIGVELTFDMYPYIRSSTILAMLVLPPQVQDGGPAATLRRLADPGIRRALLATDQFSDTFLDHIQLGALPTTHAQHAGHTITHGAATCSESPGEWTLNLLLDTRLQVGAHLDRPQLTDTDLSWVLTHPRHAAGSDGIYQGQHPHPRGYGAFARLIRHYRTPADQPDYQQLVRHLSTTAADAHRLTTRGRLTSGNTADIAVIRPDGLTDTATDDHPTTHAAGITHILINGTPVWQQNHALPHTHPGTLASP